MHIISQKKKKFVEWICGNGIAEIGGKKMLQLVCGNAIAENGRKTKNSGRNPERNFFKKNATSTIFSQQITGD